MHCPQTNLIRNLVIWLYCRVYSKQKHVVRLLQQHRTYQVLFLLFLARSRLSSLNLRCTLTNRRAFRHTLHTFRRSLVKETKARSPSARTKSLLYFVTIYYTSVLGYKRACQCSKSVRISTQKSSRLPLLFLRSLIRSYRRFRRK